MRPPSCREVFLLVLGTSQFTCTTAVMSYTRCLVSSSSWEDCSKSVRVWGGHSALSCSTPQHPSWFPPVVPVGLATGSSLWSIIKYTGK